MSELWYAVQDNAEDSEWGYGSKDKAEAIKMMMKIDDDARIAVIDGELCIEEIYKADIAERAQELEHMAKRSDEYIPSICEEICYLAELGDEWDTADGDSFEDVLKKACDILGINIWN